MATMAAPTVTQKDLYDDKAQRLQETSEGSLRMWTFRGSEMEAELEVGEKRAQGIMEWSPCKLSLQQPN